nr:histidine-rich glycoprotein [Helicoverpa armigera]
MLLKIFCVIAVTSGTVSAAPGHSSQYLLKHEGHHHLIHINDDHHHHHSHHDHQHIDYYTHPKHEFEYDVKDPYMGDHKELHEHRDGDIMKGHLFLHEPDGTVRHVQYLADKNNGFHADMKHSSTRHQRHHHHHVPHVHLLHHHHHG